MMCIMSTRAQQKQQSRSRILQSAARAVREKGYAGVGVADVMRQAGLTHGGFYAHFASREELLAAAVVYAGEQAAELLQTLARGEAPEPPGLTELVDTYLSSLHLSVPGFGCPMPALAADTARQSGPVRHALDLRVDFMSQWLSEALKRAGVAPDECGPKALTAVATMVGAMSLARATADRERAEAVLQAARTHLLSQHFLKKD